MIRQVLDYLHQKPVRLTEIKKHFDLPASMAANFVIWLEDAGFVEECQGSGCTSCSGGCGQHQGNCGGCSINAPYRLTEAGIAFLRKATPVRAS